MKSIFDKAVYGELLSRIDNLQPTSERKWGVMLPAQMLNHCTHPLAVGLGREVLKKPNLIMRILLRNFKKSLYNDTPWKRNLPTVRQYKVTSEKDFYEEKKALLELVNDFHNTQNFGQLAAHPAFGHFTLEQWGQLQYKHLDHHLSQFGC